MPRRIINNENDASKFLADCLQKTAKGDMLPGTLQVITNAVTTYNSGKKQWRDAGQKKKEQEEIAEIIEEIENTAKGSLGLRLRLRKDVSDFKGK